MPNGQVSDLAVPALVRAAPPPEGQVGCESNPAQPSASLPARPSRPGTTARGIIKITSFFVLVAALAFALDHAINHGLRSIRTSKFGSFNRVVQGRVNADIIISGSSRALSHYDPRMIQQVTGYSAYNIGMNASQIDFELAVLSTYLMHNLRPKLVVQNLDLFSLETTKSQGIYDPGYYIPYLGEQDIYRFLREVDPNVWKWKYIPLYGYTVEDMRFTWVWGLLGCIGVSGPEDYYLGFNPRDRVWNADFSHFKAANRKGVSYSIMPAGVEALEGIIKLCNERKIGLILVYSPEYYEMQEIENNRPEIIRKFQEVADEFGVPFWDYSGSGICRQREFFNNSQHLNREGATFFSADFARRLATERPWERSAQVSSFRAGRADSGAVSAEPNRSERPEQQKLAVIQGKN
jgi:hypothetical protein